MLMAPRVVDVVTDCAEERLTRCLINNISEDNSWIESIPCCCVFVVGRTVSILVVLSTLPADSMGGDGGECVDLVIGVSIP
jgi:hypothetical protein